jgi:putative protein-disulfide isomerase
MAELIYGFDPLCGWCYGIVPAVRRVAEDHPEIPIRLVMAGLVSGERVGPYGEMEGYIRGASGRLREVTGRGPTEAFFQLITTPGVEGNSGPPSLAVLRDGQARVLPSEYDPGRLSELVGQAAA